MEIENKTEMKGQRLNISLRTARNAYLLDVDDEGYIYFNEQALVDGIYLHVGLGRTNCMTDTERACLMNAIKDGAAEKLLQQENNELRKQVRKLKLEIRKLKKYLER
jgi:hypothetical protein